jgi:hypothetical protein
MRKAALAAALLASGCYTIRYERPSLVADGAAPQERWHHGVVGGLVAASPPVPLEQLCPHGVAWVETQVDAPAALAQLLTSFGGLWFVHAPLWEPTAVRVACARPAGQSALRAGRTLKVVVLPLVALGGVTKETTQLLGDALAGELRRRPGVSVLTQSDVAALLGVEKTRQMMGCADSGCLAEIGGALGADRVVHGSLGRVGGSLVVNLSALDPRRASAPASVSERLRGDRDEAFLDALPGMASALLTEQAP